MKRYCIDNKEERYENVEIISEIDNNGIRTHKFTILSAGAADIKVKLMFPECGDMIREIVESEEENGFAETEKNMYQDILVSVYSEELMLLDIYLHMHYTVLYDKNKSSFVPLAGGRKLKICESCREQKDVNSCVQCDEFKECEKYKDYRDYNNDLKRKRKNLGDYEKKDRRKKDICRLIS